jgi:cysteine synthase A
MSFDADAFVEQTISDSKQPVVVFALEWCEFCWSVRKFFKKVELEFISIDLDSVAYQNDQRGQKIRAALTERTEIKTIPQIFIGGELVGGCTELFDAWKTGSAQALLDKYNASYNAGVTDDPYGFLPTWLHPR